MKTMQNNCQNDMKITCVLSQFSIKLLTALCILPKAKYVLRWSQNLKVASSLHILFLELLRMIKCGVVIGESYIIAMWCQWAALDIFPHGIFMA